MSPYELKKIQVEYKRVNAAREEQELKILEIQKNIDSLKENIDRLQKSIEISIAKEDELLAKIKDSQLNSN